MLANVTGFCVAITKKIPDVFNRYLTLFHRSQQRALRLWGGSVYLIGEYKLTEYRVRMKKKSLVV